MKNVKNTAIICISPFNSDSLDASLCLGALKPHICSIFVYFGVKEWSEPALPEPDMNPLNLCTVVLCHLNVYVSLKERFYQMRAGAIDFF